MAKAKGPDLTSTSENPGFSQHVANVDNMVSSATPDQRIAGIGWYRKIISVPSNLLNGPELFLQFDGAYSVTSLYIDGTQAASTVAAVTLAPLEGLAIGSNAKGDVFFGGELDEVAVYGAALPADRIADHIAIATSGPDASTWPLFRWLH